MSGDDSLRVQSGTSRERDPVRAVQEVWEGIRQEGIRFILFYCDPAYDLEALAKAIEETMGHLPVVGCTTAGEITPLGYLEGTFAAISIASSSFTPVIRRIDNLASFEFAVGVKAARSALEELEQRGVRPSGDNTFGFLLIDGLSLKEEIVVSAVRRHLADIRIFGGSAADGGRFQQAHVYHEGRFRRDCAVVTMVHTTHPFTVFKTQHFVSGAEKMVVTEADPARRVVTGINGAPAAEEYARVVGLDVTELTPMTFAEYPVVVKVGGAYYVRSIQRVLPDRSLSFFCAIDEGIVLTVAHGVDMIQNLRETFDGLRASIGEPELILGCDCILRKLELQRKGLMGDAGRLFVENRTFGFSTYGEQFNAMHVNQTFTGVALGRSHG